MTNEEAIRRGEHAKQLLKDALLIETLDAIESDVLAQWEACPARDVEGREELWKYYKTAKKFRGILEGTAQSGNVADFREKQSAMDKVSNFVKGKKNG